MSNATTIQHAPTFRQRVFRETVGDVAAIAAPAAILSTVLPIADALDSKVLKINSKFRTSNKVEIGNNAENVLRKLGLNSFGVKIVDLRYAPHRDEALYGLSEKSKDMYKKMSPLYKTLNGKHALFTAFPMGTFGQYPIEKNSIIINMHKTPAMAFHELGHAHNATKSVIFKNIQKASGYATLAAGALLVWGALSRRLYESKQNNLTSKTQKANNFVRDNIGLISAAILAPGLVEDFCASLKAKKWIKESLNPKYAKKTLNCNRIALASNIIISAALIGASIAAVKVKDVITKKGKSSDNRVFN